MNYSWENAVRWYRAQPGNEQAVRDNYFDLPVAEAAERFARSEETAEVRRLLGPGRGRALLDLGAGNGIASYALARDGWVVTALEPDPSAEVGAAAIEELTCGMAVRVVREVGERLPFGAETFAAVHARQVLHHLDNLETGLREVARVLQPGGWLLATREHVADDDVQLAEFRRRHPLHALYGGEQAHALPRYETAIREAGLRLAGCWGPLESILNFHPLSERRRQAAIHRLARARWGGLGWIFSFAPAFRRAQLARATRRDHTPGRLFSFFAQKPRDYTPKLV